MSEPRMMIVVEGTIRAIYVTGGMTGGINIKHPDGEHPGVTPERVSADFYSTMLLTPVNSNFFQEVASKAALVARDRKLIDTFGNVKDQSAVLDIIAGIISEIAAPANETVSIPPEGPTGPEHPWIEPTGEPTGTPAPIMSPEPPLEEAKLDEPTPEAELPVPSIDLPEHEHATIAAEKEEASTNPAVSS